MTIFSMVVGFVSALGVFGTLDSGVDVNLDDANETFEGFSGITMNSFFDFIFSPTGTTTLVGIAGTIALAILTHSPSIIGAGIFSTVFWTSFVNVNMILSVGGYMPMAFITISFVVMGFLWIGAVIGMITGSG